jgi:hypothetical protein
VSQSEEDNMNVSVQQDGTPKGRDDITVGHVEVPVKVHRTDGFPTIFAGFQAAWIDGEDPATDTTFRLTAGAGFGSKYATITVEIPGRPIVYEYFDVTELFSDRVEAILREHFCYDERHDGPRPRPCSCEE